MFAGVQKYAETPVTGRLYLSIGHAFVNIHTYPENGTYYVQIKSSGAFIAELPIFTYADKPLFIIKGGDLTCTAHAIKDMLFLANKLVLNGQWDIKFMVMPSNKGMVSSTKTVLFFENTHGEIYASICSKNWREMRPTINLLDILKITTAAYACDSGACDQGKPQSE
jgi:hypothetical protein